MGWWFVKAEKQCCILCLRYVWCRATTSRFVKEKFLAHLIRTHRVGTNNVIATLSPSTGIFVFALPCPLGCSGFTLLLRWDLSPRRRRCPSTSLCLPTLSLRTPGESFHFSAVPQSSQAKSKWHCLGYANFGHRPQSHTYPGKVVPLRWLRWVVFPFGCRVVFHQISPMTHEVPGVCVEITWKKEEKIRPRISPSYWSSIYDLTFNSCRPWVITGIRMILFSKRIVTGDKEPKEEMSLFPAPRHTQFFYRPTGSYVSVLSPTVHTSVFKKHKVNFHTRS